MRQNSSQEVNKGKSYVIVTVQGAYMKKLYFGSNLKMYKGIQETKEYLQKLAENAKDLSREDFELFILPSFTSLPDAVRCIDKADISLGAQNMCWEEWGQFTGEISPCMLEELGVELVMIGHSERRHIFGESSTEENRKVIASLKHGLNALLCIGETAEEKGYGITEEVLRTQLKVGLHDVEKVQTKKLWIAYEPVWSIGEDGLPASAEYAQAAHRIIRETLMDIFGESGWEVPILYGGSVNLENARELIIQPSIDGLFVGRSAWDADKFDELIRSAIAAVSVLSK